MREHTDQVKIFLCFLIAILLGWVQWAWVRGTVFRHVYSLATGLGLALFQYGLRGMFGFAFTSLIVYVMLLVLPRHRVALPVFIFSFGFLSYVHIHRMMVDWMGWSQDYSTMQMILTCKLTSLAFAYQDGTPKKDTARELTPTEQDQQACQVKELPNLLEYYSFLAFFAGFLVGPVYEYSDYIRFVKLQDEFKDIPCPIKRSVTLAVQAIACVAGFLFLFEYFHYSFIIKPEWNLLPYWYKILFINIGMIACKLRYFTGFKFGEAGIVSSGFGYAGRRPDQSVNWDRARGVCIQKCEFGQTTKVVIDNWNISVSLWLRRYVYNRLASKESPPLMRSSAQHLTMITSAFWHGFYPSYYLCFLGFSFLTEVSKMGYQSDFSWLPGKAGWAVVAWMWKYTVENLNGIVFAQLGFTETLTVLNAIYWGPYAVLMLVWMLFKTTGIHRRKRTEGRKTEGKND